MKIILKCRLWSFFSDNKLRVRVRWRGFTRLKLVEWHYKSSFDKTCLNVVKAEDIKWVGSRLSIKQDDKAGKVGDDKADIGKDDKAATRRQYDKAGKRKWNEEEDK